MPTRLEVPGPDRPDRHPYIRINHPEDGDLVFRIPSPVQVGRLTKLIPQSHWDAVSAVESVQGAEPENRLKAIMGAFRSSEDACSLAGVIIGYAWADPALVLKAEPPSKDLESSESVMQFGSAVFEELHEHGWSAGDAFGVATIIFGELGRGMSLVEAGVTKRDFTGPKRDSSSPSFSESNVVSSGDA